jgi:hypothetical protein
MDINDLYIAVDLQVFAQFGNIHIHTPAIEIGIAAPDFFQSGFPWQQIVHMLAEHFEQLVFFGR